MIGEHIRRVHRQHNSRVCTIPIGICEYLGIEAGDSVVFKVDFTLRAVTFDKLRIKGIDDGRDKRDSGRKDSDRRKRVKNGARR